MAEQDVFPGNSTLTWLPSGSHSLILHVSDKAGNVGVSETIQFTVAAITWEWSVITLVPIVAALVALLVFFRKRKRKQSAT
jgi:Co/Zn/Cd efflux system component